MVAKRSLSSIRAERRRRAKEPIDVQLTVCFRFGEEPGEYVTMIDDRRVPMVNSVFHSRDVIVRQFAKLMLKAGMAQPKVLRELLPALKLLRRVPKKT